MLLFKIFTIKKTAREIKNSPSAFVGNEAGDIIKGLFILPLFILGCSGIISFLFGYTSYIFGIGPFGIFKFFFWILCIIWISVFVLMRKISKKTESATKEYANTIFVSQDQLLTDEKERE